MNNTEILENYKKWLLENYPKSEIIQEQPDSRKIEFIAVFKTFNVYLFVFLLIFALPIGIIYYFMSHGEHKVKTIAEFDENGKVKSLNHRFNFLKHNFNNPNAHYRKSTSPDLNTFGVIIVSAFFLFFWLKKLKEDGMLDFLIF